MTNLNFDRSPQKLKTPETKISKTPLPQKIKPHFPHHTPLFTFKIKEYVFYPTLQKSLKTFTSISMPEHLASEIKDS